MKLRDLPETLLVVALAAATALASDVAAPAAPGVEVRYLAGFDGAARAGVFQEVREDGSLQELDRRPGWSLQEVHPLTLDGVPAVLLIWRDFPLQARTSPELWVEDAPPAGFEFLPPLTRVWPRGEDPVVWHEARHELVVRKGEARLRVARGLAGENQQAPLLRRKELYRLRAEGVRLEEVRSERPHRPEQVLNLLAAEVRGGRLEDPGRLQDLVRAAAKAGDLYRDRAVIEMTRLPLDTRAWETSRQLLDAMVMGGSPAAEWAAARLFEMVGKEWEVGLR